MVSYGTRAATPWHQAAPRGAARRRKQHRRKAQTRRSIARRIDKQRASGGDGWHVIIGVAALR